MQVRNAELFLETCRTRLPFRFGIATMTWAPLATLRVEIETDAGDRGAGASSDLLVPKWFAKDPGTSLREDVEQLLGSARRAVALAIDPSEQPESTFDLWRRLYDRCVRQAQDRSDRLVHGFGVSLVERAVIDAVCRAAGCSFFEALRSALLAFEPGALCPELAGWRAAQSLSARPLTSIQVRHTVGLVDALRASEVAADDRVNDGLPESLEEDIDRFGLTHFKLKLSGDAEADERRLLDIASVFERHVRGTPRFTLDGNEQFASLSDLADLLERVGATPRGRTLLDGLLYIEQPLPRAHTFDRARHAAIDRVAAFGPLIIDEADAELDSFPRAIELGYRGVSVKNCKGVFRALLNYALCDRSGGALFQSSEDLTNLPIVALQQDLATAAALGLAHSERNGHHYFAGLSHLPAAESAAALETHSDLYENSDVGPSVRIENGAVRIGSLDCPGYGHDVRLCWNERTPARRWRFREQP